MMTGAERMRAWQGWPLLTYGFRPFFLGAGLWAVFAACFWLLLLFGIVDWPMIFTPTAWHAHEFLFGYLMAAAAGFILTAVPNWTGRLPVVGRPLGLLFSLWFIGRMAVLLSADIGAAGTFVLDMAMPIALLFVIGREIVTGKNWRNLPVLALFASFTLANGIYHYENSIGAYAPQGYGLRLGLGTALMMIAVIGGRIIPSFTRNWLVKQGSELRPAPPMQRLDKIAVLTLLLVLFLWLLAPMNTFTAILLILAGALHIARLSRWKGMATWAEPLLFVLHVGYSFLPLGALFMGLSILLPNIIPVNSAQHLWALGAIGTMTLAVMTRATLGHTGQNLHANSGTIWIYVLVISAAWLRFLAGIIPSATVIFYALSGLAWIMAFALFVAFYGSLLLRKKE